MLCGQLPAAVVMNCPKRSGWCRPEYTAAWNLPCTLNMKDVPCALAYPAAQGDSSGCSCCIWAAHPCAVADAAPTGTLLPVTLHADMLSLASGKYVTASAWPAGSSNSVKKVYYGSCKSGQGDKHFIVAGSPYAACAKQISCSLINGKGRFISRCGLPLAC